VLYITTPHQIGEQDWKKLGLMEYRAEILVISITPAKTSERDPVDKDGNVPFRHIALYSKKIDSGR
jgi:hypothetical protein